MKFRWPNTTTKRVPGFALAALSLGLALPLPAQSAFLLSGRLISSSVLSHPGAPSETAGDDDEEASLAAIKKSRITSIPLPEGAFRFTGKKQTEPLMEALSKFAEQQKFALGANEVLVWQNGKAAQEAFPDLCDEAGYRYKAQPGIDSEEGHLTLFTCQPKQKDGKKSALFGFWGTNGDTLVLTWAVAKPKAAEGEEAAAEEEAPAARPVSDRKATPRKKTRPAAESQEGKIPADLQGDWSWTTIGSVGYRDTTTHQLAEPSGMSARFTFTRDGRYKKFFYVRQRTYSLVTESTTTEEGRVTFADGTFTMVPDKGYYKGHTGSRIVDRPMTKEERKPTTYHWEWRNEDGKRHLYLGPTKDSVRLFKPAK